MNAATDTGHLSALGTDHDSRSRWLRRAAQRLGSYRPSDREIVLGLVLAVVIVFGHALYNDFVQWDDPVNLINNKHFRGLGWAQIQWMFTTTLMGHYIPITWLTFGLDYLLWGMEPAGYHFTNLVLHTANVVLFFLLGRRLLARALPWATPLELHAGAALAALFFGIHPLRAESVAWATERRDVLSGLMFLACVLCYVTATEADGIQRRRRLAVAWLFFGLALLSKSITMTLPAALIILDVYPLRRLGVQPREWLGAGARRVLVEKIPFVVLGLVGAMVSYWAVARNDYLTSTVQYPFMSRVALALYSTCFYIAKTVLPVGLSPLYELPATVSLLDPQFALAAAAAVLMTIALLGLWRAWPAGCAAYVYFAITIAPVGGLVHAGFQLAHDRYSYLSCMGFALLAGAIPPLLSRARAQGSVSGGLVRLSAAAIIAWIVALGALTWEQVRVWRDTESLWLHAALAEPECSICHLNRGATLVNRMQPEAALTHFVHIITIRPDKEKVYGGVGLALIQLNRAAEAEPHLKRALAKDGFDAGLLNNLGIALSRQGKFQEALPYFRRALVLEPSNIRARSNYAAALAGSGRIDLGLTEFHRAAQEDAFAVEPRIGLVRAYLQKGDVMEAAKQFTILRQLHPKAAERLAELLAP
jgi:Flp pilus assembly protein TadD